jgi:hypothetical protein
LLLGAGGVVVTAEVLTSAGYFDSGREDPNKLGDVTPQKTTAPESDTVTDEERQQLGWVHRRAVEIFIDRPGFGMRRLPLYVEDLVTDPKSLAARGDTKRTSIAPPIVVPAEAGKPVHHGVQETTNQWKLGIASAKDPKQRWTVRQVQLVGLVKHPQPVVYLTDKLPDMTEAKDVPMREPDTFETEALASFRGGENLKIEKRGDEIRMMGTIYAGASCVKCHEEKGKLLGAFTYRLERVPVEKRDLP